MKKFYYYLALFFIWLIIHILFGTAMLTVGAIEGSFPTPLIALAVAVLIPEYWLISIGLAMLTRDILAKKILGEGKKHSKIIPIVLVALGTIMVSVSVSISAIWKTRANEATERKAPRKLEISIDNYTTLQDDLEMSEESFCSNDLLLAKTILDYKAGINETFENLGKEVPIRIDEILTLGKVSVTESEYTLFYQLNVEKDDFRQYELDNLIKETGEDMEFEFYYPTLSLCRIVGVNPSDFFKNSNIKFVCIFSDINNEFIGFCEIDFKDFAGKQH